MHLKNSPIRIYAMILLSLLLLFICAGNENISSLINVLNQDKDFVNLPLIPNAPDQAGENAKRIHAIMEKAAKGAAIHFPAGDYYFNGSALPNRGSIETTQPGQTLFGDGPELTRIFQLNLEQNFGFKFDKNRKHVPTATIRVRHKGCTIRDLAVAVDPRSTENTIAPSAAIQIAHIAYLPDNNIGIIETTGIGDDFLLDNVAVKNVNIGVHHGGGIQGTRFFEIGIDITGSGGLVKVSRVDRLDAKFGIRLDNGNHCGQGDYYFDNIFMIGKHNVTNGGVFFDWIGGQLAMIRNCETGYANAFHAGPLGATGDRLEPFPEAEVHRSPERNWDWLTWHNHPVAAEPDAAQIREWYGLPRHASIVRIGSQPRTGGKEWIRGEHYTIETVKDEGPLQFASKIRWIKDPPDPGSTYYVTFQQPMEYRVHDLEWGMVSGCFFGEANQLSDKGYAFKFEDQGFGSLNPDFQFPVGYGLIISNNTAINGNLVFDGNCGYIKVLGNTFGVFNIFLQGGDKKRQAREITLDNNSFNAASIGNWVSMVRFHQNRLEGSIAINAPLSATNLLFEENIISCSRGPALSAMGNGIENLRLTGNTISCQEGNGLELENVRTGIINDNSISGCSGAGMELRNCSGLLVSSNILSGNKTGLHIKADRPNDPLRIWENLILDNKTSGFLLTTPNKEILKHITIGDNTFSRNGKDTIIEEAPQYIEMPIFWHIKEFPVISIHSEIHHEPPILIFAVFPEGQIIWTDHHDNLKFLLKDKSIRKVNEQGGPFYYATIPKDQITSLILKINHMGILGDPGQSPFSIMPNSKETCMTINTPDFRLQMKSCHEAMESFLPDSYYSFNGEVINKKDMSYESFLNTQPPDYKKFRQNWDILKKEIFALLPESKVQLKKVIGMRYKVRKIDAVNQKKILEPGEIDAPTPTKDQLIEKITALHEESKKDGRTLSAQELLEMSHEPVPAMTPGTFGEGPVYFINP